MTEHSTSRGDTQIFDVKVPGATAKSGAKRYPGSPLAPLRDLVRFDWAAMDEWLEEDEPVDGVTVADSARPHILFETGLPPRYYLPLPESQKIAGLACFYDEKVDVYPDGELQPRPRTRFS